jgi:hypothetical protein
MERKTFIFNFAKSQNQLSWINIKIVATHDTMFNLLHKWILENNQPLLEFCNPPWIENYFNFTQIQEQLHTLISAQNTNEYKTISHGSKKKKKTY